jgi:hypothetical protein
MEVERALGCDKNDVVLLNLIDNAYSNRASNDHERALVGVAKAMFQQCLYDISKNDISLDAYVTAMKALTLRGYWTTTESNMFISMFGSLEMKTPETVTVDDEKKVEVNEKEAAPSDPKKRRRDDLPDLAKVVEEAKIAAAKEHEELLVRIAAKRNGRETSIHEEAVAAARHFFEQAPKSNYKKIRYATKQNSYHVLRELRSLFPGLRNSFENWAGVVTFFPE